MPSKEKTLPHKTNSLFKISNLIITALLAALIASGIRISNLSSQLSESQSEYANTDRKIYELESKLDTCKSYTKWTKDKLKGLKSEIQVADNSVSQALSGNLYMSLSQDIDERVSIFQDQKSELQAISSALVSIDVTTNYILNELDNCL